MDERTALPGHDGAGDTPGSRQPGGHTARHLGLTNEDEDTLELTENLGRDLASGSRNDETRKFAEELLSSIFPSWPGTTGIPEVMTITDAPDGRALRIQIDQTYYKHVPDIVDRNMAWLVDEQFSPALRSSDQDIQAEVRRGTPPEIRFAYSERGRSIASALGALFGELFARRLLMSCLLDASNRIHIHFIRDTDLRMRSGSLEGHLHADGGARRWIEAYYRGAGKAELQEIYRNEWVTRWPYERTPRR